MGVITSPDVPIYLSLCLGVSQEGKFKVKRRRSDARSCLFLFLCSNVCDFDFFLFRKTCDKNDQPREGNAYVDGEKSLKYQFTFTYDIYFFFYMLCKVLVSGHSFVLFVCLFVWCSVI